MINVYKMFSKRDFSWKHPIRNIKRIFKSFRWSRQRAKYGYCDYDLGEVYAWFAELMPRMIRELKENYIGHPMDNDLYNECYDAHGDELDMSREEFLALTPHIDMTNWRSRTSSCRLLSTPATNPWRIRP